MTPRRQPDSSTEVECRCRRSPWPAAATRYWAGRREPVTVLSIEPNGDAWIVDRDGDVIAVESSRIRLVDPGALLDQAAAAS